MSVQEEIKKYITVELPNREFVKSTSSRAVTSERIFRPRHPEFRCYQFCFQQVLLR